jgi:hypothetical protein
MNSFSTAAFLCIFLAVASGYDETSPSMATIKPQNKALRGQYHSSPSDPITVEKNGFVTLAGFQFDGPKASSIQAQFFHDEEPIMFVKGNEKNGVDEYYWYGEDINAHANTLNLLVTDGIEGSSIIG